MQDMQAAKTPDGRLLAVFTLRLPPGDTLASRPVLYVRVLAACPESAQIHSTSCAGFTAWPGLPHAPFLCTVIHSKNAVQARNSVQNLH